MFITFVATNTWKKIKALILLDVILVSHKSVFLNFCLLLPLCASASAGMYSREILEHLSPSFMLLSSRKPLYMHWNLPTGGPKRWAITSPSVRLSLRRICERGTWPPPALTLECCGGFEYEIQTLKEERAKLNPGLLKAARVNPSRGSLKAVCADLR